MPVQSKLGLDTVSEGWNSVESNNATHSASDSEVRTPSSDSSEGPTFQHIEDISTYVEPDTDNEHTVTENQDHAGVAQNQAAGDDPLTGHAPAFDHDDDDGDVPSDSSTAGSVSSLSLSSSDSVAGSEHASQSASVFRGLERTSATGVEAGRSSPVRSLAIPSGLSCVTDQYGNHHRRVKPFGNSPRFHGFPRLRMAAREESPEDEEFSVLGNGNKRNHAHDNEIVEETNTDAFPSQATCRLATRRCGVRFPRSSVSSDGDNTHTTPFSELCDDCRAARLVTMNDESDLQSLVAFSWSAPGSPVPSFVSGFFDDDNEEQGEGEGEEDELSLSQLSISERPVENGVGSANANATEQSTDGEAIQEQTDAANVSVVDEPDVAEPDQLTVITVTPVFGAASTAGTAAATTAGGDSTVRTEATIRHDLSDHRNKDKHGDNYPAYGHFTVTYDSASSEERALDIVEYEHGRELQSNDTPTATSTNGGNANTTPASEFPCIVNETTANRDCEYDADDESAAGALLLVDVDSPGVSPESGYVTGLAEVAGSMGAGTAGYEALDNANDDGGWI